MVSDSVSVAEASNASEVKLARLKSLARWAKTWNLKGVSTLFVDGKSPAHTHSNDELWKWKQNRIQSLDELKGELNELQKYRVEITGIGIIFGPVSGNLIGIDIDCSSTAIRDNVCRGYSMITGHDPLTYASGNGYYVLYRVDGDTKDVEHIAKVCKFNAGEHIEVRWHGHYSVAPGSLHKNGKMYQWEDENIRASYGLEIPVIPDIPTISIVQHKRIVAYLAALDTTKKQQQPKDKYLYDYKDVINEYNTRHTITESLLANGYTDCGKYWKHPHNDSMPNGSCHVFSDTNRCHHFGANDPAGCGSTSDPFDLYVKFSHNGNSKEAIKTVSREYGMDGGKNAASSNEFSPRSVSILVKEKRPLPEPIIDGILRRRTVMNIIGETKSNKTWFAIQLALSVASGKTWLEKYPTKQNKVLLLDNELQPESLTHRIIKVSDALDINTDSLEDWFYVDSLKGKLQDIYNLEEWLTRQPRGTYGLILLDSLYRFYPCDRNFSENSNADITKIYNTLDKIAMSHDCAIICVHHTSKGNQSQKDITDLGSGAGAFSRAVDTHIALREQRVENVFTFDSALRDFPQINHFCLKFNFPIFELTDGDPNALKIGRHQFSGENGYTPEKFVNDYLSDELQKRDIILHKATTSGLTHRDAVRLFGEADDAGLITKVGTKYKRTNSSKQEKEDDEDDS